MINRTLAQRYFPNGDAIGHSLRSGGLEGNPATVMSPPNIGATWFQIVGIVGDARNDGLRSAPRPSVYLPYTFSMGEGTEILVRSEVPPLTLQHAVREQLRAINRGAGALWAVGEGPGYWQVCRNLLIMCQRLWEEMRSADDGARGEYTGND